MSKCAITKPKERPIIFRAESVLAIDAGKKTQTRRAIKRGVLIEMDEGNAPPIYQSDPKFGKAAYRWMRCPYGNVGDRLWVRESFQVCSYCAGEYGGQGEAGYTLKSINPKPPDGTYCIFYRADAEDGPWRPSIHMPRWASRILLEVVGIRVERLQDITEEDAKAEGVLKYDGVCGQNEDGSYKTGYTVMGVGSFPTAVEGYRFGWNVINEKRGYGWDKNPWVWVVEFKRLKGGS